MNSTITLFYNCLVEKDKNFILDNDGEKAIELYLQTLTSKTITDFQYIKQSLSVSIRIDASQIGLCMGANCDDLNYVKIQNGGQNPCYYFIISKTWKSANTIELVLSMDTLNTYKYDSDYEVSQKTLVKREHKDRFSKLTCEHSFTISGLTINVPADYYFTNYEIQHSDFIEAEIIILNAQAYAESVVIDGETYLKIGILPKNYGGSRNVKVIYTLKGMLSIIDLKSEEINVPTYKKLQTTFYDKKGESQVNWALYYKTADNQETTPVDCYLVPSEPINVQYQSSDELDKNNVPLNKYFMICGLYNGNLSIKADGVTYSAIHYDQNGITYEQAIAIYNDGSHLSIYTTTFRSDRTSGSTYWSKRAENLNSIQVVTPVEDIDGYESASLVTTSDFWSNQLFLATAFNQTITLGTMSQSFVSAINDIDKTLSTNIKIINIPYSPTAFEVDSDYYIFEDCWYYNSTDKNLKLIDFTKFFENEIDTQVDNILNVFPVNMNDVVDITEDIARTFKDSKLLHSDYYRPKFVYDSFTKIFHLETIDYQHSNRDENFKFNFVMSRNIVSKFLFKFTQFSYLTALEDYENIVAVSRNNEEVLYNSQYLDYIRTGYNYDLKAKERAQNTNLAGIGINVAGLLTSLGIGALTGNPLSAIAVAGATYGLVSQLVTYAKNTAQNEENIQRKLQETQMQAISVMNADDFDLLYAYSQNKAKLCIYECSDKMKEVLDDLFFYCGYVVNEQKKPDTNTRRSFNFVQASLVINHTNNLTGEIQSDIEEKFENGVTFLHYSFNKFDFNQDKENIELSLL